MSASFTPGPWFVHDFRAASSEPSARDITVSCDRPATITVCSMDRALTAEMSEALANARLIAAAPSLYEALTAFVDIRDQFPESGKLINKNLDGLAPIQVTITKDQFLVAIRALAKARGEQS